MRQSLKNPINPHSGRRLFARNEANFPPFALAVLAIAIAGLAFFVDLELQLGVAAGISYIAIVLIGWWAPDWRYIVALAAAGVALVILGFFVSPPGVTLWVVLTNRLISALIIALTAGLLIIAKRAQQALALSEKRGGQILDNAVSGVITMDETAHVVSFNRAAERLFGYTADEVIGENIKILMPESYSVHHDQYVGNYLTTGEAKIIGFGREVDGRRKDGVVFPMDLGISELDVDGIRMFTGTVIDITDHKAAEIDLRRAKEEAEEANRAKSDFLSSMSHELRTPLNAILGFAQVLETDTDYPLTETQTAQIRIILQSGDHLLSLINDVLDLAQIESGIFSLNIKIQNPESIVRECVSIASHLSIQSGIKVFDRVVPWNLPEINIDSTRFRQVLLNLLSNAIKYNGENGSVTMLVEQPQIGHIRFSVADTGRGIALENQDELFQPFSRLDMEVSDIPGTGIGLSITKQLVERMGGRIGFESALGLGSTFWLEFPIASGALTEKVGEDKPAVMVGGAPTDTMVLCVEDNPSSLELLGMIVERIPGTFMSSAHTAELGLNLAEIYHPGVILMDINLPGMDGFAAVSRLKSSPLTKDIPVIALTAMASEADRDRGLAAGFNSYLTKPIKIGEVTQEIKRAINQA